MNKLLLSLYGLAALLLTACHNHSEADHHDHDGHDEHDEHVEASEHNHAEGLIELSEDEAKSFGVVADLPVPASVGTAITLPGIVTGNADSESVLTAAKAGKLFYKSALHEGMPVSRGQLLASIAATGVSGGDADASLRARLKAVESEIARVRPLVDEGIVTRKDYNALLAQADELRQLTTSAGGSGAISSPVNGVVAEVIAGPGSFVQPGDPVVRLRGNSKGSLYIKVAIPQRYISQLIKTQTVRLSDGTVLPRHSTAPGTDAAGASYAYFGPLSSSDFTVGSTVEASIVSGESDCQVTVPAESINEQEGVFTVFVKEAAGHYRRVPVEIGRFDGSRYEILSGLSATDSVITSGAVFVRLAETRANAPQGHTHNH